MKRAQHCYERAVHAKRAALGPAHPSVSASLVALARLVAERGDLQQASALLEQQLQYVDGQGQQASRGGQLPARCSPFAKVCDLSCWPRAL